MLNAQTWERVRSEWRIMTFYQRFETAVALVLSLVIGIIILVALYRLGLTVLGGLIVGAVDPFDQRAFQIVFGDIMTVLIALEFNHTLQYVVRREQSIIQTKVVLLIALLAAARKFIVLELPDVAPEDLWGLAAVTLALGAVYWLIRDREARAGQAT